MKSLHYKCSLYSLVCRFYGKTTNRRNILGRTDKHFCIGKIQSAVNSSATAPPIKADIEMLQGYGNDFFGKTFGLKNLFQKKKHLQLFHFSAAEATSTVAPLLFVDGYVVKRQSGLIS